MSAKKEEEAACTLLSARLVAVGGGRQALVASDGLPPHFCVSLMKIGQDSEAGARRRRQLAWDELAPPPSPPPTHLPPCTFQIRLKMAAQGGRSLFDDSPTPPKRLSAVPPPRRTWELKAPSGWSRISSKRLLLVGFF